MHGALRVKYYTAGIYLFKVSNRKIAHNVNNKNTRTKSITFLLLL